MTTAIATENLNTGTSAWQITSTSTSLATTQIQAYCDKCSYNPGDMVTFFASVQVAATTYTITIYRLGWYGGTGGCLKHTSPTQTGVAQGYWNASNTTLTNCPTAIIDATTHNLETGWASSYTWAIPSSAVTGVYLAQFTDANGKQTCCSFVVKNTVSTSYVYVRPTTTDCAYNDWGGFSLYTNPGVGVKVSFNRPDVNGAGTGGLLRFEIPGIKWLERQGYDLSYLTSIDIHSNAAQLTSYKCMLSAGHDEYWSLEMRSGVESALAQGVGLAFLGANACYWQIRFENDNAGHANRTVTCYKIGTVATVSNDPYWDVDNTRITSNWRSYPLNRPENALIGIMFSSFVNPSPAANFGWTVDTNADTTYFTSTGLVKGTTYGYDCVGYEWDRVFLNGVSPANLKTIATTAVTDHVGAADTANSTTYVAPSGALVFASGAIDWVNALDTYRWITQSGGTPAEIAGMQQLFANIMADLAKGRTLRSSSFAYHS